LSPELYQIFTLLTAAVDRVNSLNNPYKDILLTMFHVEHLGLVLKKTMFHVEQ